MSSERTSWQFARTLRKTTRERVPSLQSSEKNAHDTLAASPPTLRAGVASFVRLELARAYLSRGFFRLPKSSFRRQYTFHLNHSVLLFSINLIANQINCLFFALFEFLKMFFAGKKRLRPPVDSFFVSFCVFL